MITARATAERRAWLLCLVAIGAAACSAGPPAPAGASSTGAPTTPEGSAIAEPLDLRGREACTLLGPAGVVALHLRPEPVARDTGPSATTCVWMSVDGTVGVNLVANFGAGLDRLDRVADALEERTPLTVGGYPAIRLDHVGSPTCRIAVGVADSQLISAEASSLSADAPPLCPLAEALAEEVVSALRG